MSKRFLSFGSIPGQSSRMIGGITITRCLANGVVWAWLNQSLQIDSVPYGPEQMCLSPSFFTHLVSALMFLRTPTIISRE
jgi:hypothetical protein